MGLGQHFIEGFEALGSQDSFSDQLLPPMNDTILIVFVSQVD